MKKRAGVSPAFFWFFADYRGRVLGMPGFRSHRAHGSPSASRARLRRRFVHLGVSRGDLGAHPRCSDRSSAFGAEGRCAAYLSIWPTAAHLCGTRLEGGRQGLSRRYGRVQGEPVRDASSAPAAPGTSGRSGRGCWYPVAQHLRRACVGVLAGDAVAALARPREPHGSGESSVPTLEASSAQVSGRRPHKTRREAAFRTERGGPV